LAEKVGIRKKVDFERSFYLCGRLFYQMMYDIFRNIHLAFGCILICVVDIRPGRLGGEE